MSSVVISGDTSGAITLAAPAVAGTTTLTLPATTGTMALQSDVIGIGQTWTDVSASRAVGTTYTNSTGKPITVVYVSTAAATVSIMIGGVSIASMYSPTTFLVPAGLTYSITSSTLQKWAELR